jgi:hypothetical protein
MTLNRMGRSVRFSERILGMRWGEEGANWPNIRCNLNNSRENSSFGEMALHGDGVNRHR